MKEKLKYTILILTIIISIILPENIIFAAGMPELSVETDKANLEPGEEFTVSVNFNNNGSTDCLGFDFGLKYDKTILEVVNSTIELEKGATVINDKIPGSVNFVLVSIEPIEYTGKLFSVTFRVKKEANGGESVLKISPDNSETPIENENGSVKTNTIPTTINISAPIKIKNDTGFKTTSELEGVNETGEKSTEINNNKEENSENVTTLNPEKINDIDESEDEETIKNKENNSKSEKKEQIGLPTKVVTIILAISAIGLISIFLMLKKKKK